MQRSVKRANLEVQQLERRDTPAGGKVSVIIDANDNLIVRGDNQSNTVRIFFDNSGRLIARGLDGTKLVKADGREVREFSLGFVTLTGMDVKLRGGNDAIQIVGSTTDPFVQNSVLIDAGDGNDLVEVIDCQIGDKLTVLGQSGNDRIRLANIDAFEIRAMGQGGNDKITFDGAFGDNAARTFANGGGGTSNTFFLGQNPLTVEITNFQRVVRI